MSILDGYIPETQLATEFNKTRRTIQRWRKLHIGPPVTLIGNAPFYRRDAVQNWLLTQERPVGRRQR